MRFFLKMALSAALIITLYLGFKLISGENSMLPQLNSFDRVEFIGEYKIDGGEWQKMTKSSLPPIDLNRPHKFAFRGSLSNDIAENVLIMLRITDLEVSIFKNGRKIYSFGEKESRHEMFESPGNVWVSFMSPGISASDDMEIIVTTVYEQTHPDALVRFFENIYYGTYEGLWRMKIRENGISIIISAFMLILGILELIAAVELAFMKQSMAERCLYGAGFAISCGVWFGIQYDVISLLIPYPALVGTFDMLSFYFLALFFTLYIGTFLVQKRKLVSQLTSCFVLCALLWVLMLEISGIMDAYYELNVIVISVIAAMFVSLTALFFECRTEQGRRLYPLFWTTLPICAGIVVDSIYIAYGSESTAWLDFGVLIYAGAQWSFTIRQFKLNSDALFREEHMKNEVVQSRISVMLSQIQPHFLYNSLATIKSLCIKDPVTAKNAVGSFAQYLRANMDSLSRNKLIPLEQELRHVENYLYIEKLRFRDKINIVNNFQTKYFGIPALTIQPIVENAVKHGIMKRELGGTITISTDETSTHFVLKVSDDGVGFDANSVPSAERSHIGIENVRKRLEFMCKGTMSIESIIGEGTSVTINIPKGE